MTSGLGPEFGGIGVVSEQLVRAVGAQKENIWRHHHSWPALLRRGGLVAQASVGALLQPRLVIYEHVGLSAIHRTIPWLARRPYAVFLHGTEVWTPLSGRSQASLEGAAILLANSQYTVNEARKQNPWLSKTSVVHLGIPLGSAGPPQEKRAPLALMVGRMAAAERYKGHDQVLEAWPRIRSLIPAAELVIVGEGDDRSRLEAAAAGIGGVRFTGWVTNDVLSQHYRSSRLLIHPSLREGFGLTAIEAAAAGAVVLGIRGTVLEELFPVAGSVALASSQSASDIADAVVPLLEDIAEASRISAAASSLVREHYQSVDFIERLRSALARWLY